MKIRSIQLKNFKRFTDLTLTGIPENTKLVLLIGSNGSGKSCVFDAFEAANKMLHKAEDKKDLYSFTDPIEYEYYHKKVGEFFEIRFLANNSLKEQYLTTHAGNLVDSGNKFYGRTSFRNVSRLLRSALGTKGINFEADEDRPKTFIDVDERFENDVELSLGNILSDVFRTSVTTKEIREKYLNPLNESLERVFKKSNGTKLSITEFVPPLEGQPFDIKFAKGNSVISYNLLSAGEKSIIILLLNFQARAKYFKDTLFYIDEADIHLNTALQQTLLQEIIEHWLPANSQLWTASHSLGFIQYAKENVEAAIFDFDDYDFDYPKVLSPVVKDSPDFYEIAVSKQILPSLFKNYRIFFVENKDKLVYSELNIANTLFIQENGKAGVYHKVKNGAFSGIVDRDFLTDDDIIEIEKQYSSLKILRYYSVENYLFHPDNLVEYYESANKIFNKSAYVQKLFDENLKITDQLIRKLALVRTTYPFFKEPDFQNSPNQKKFSNADENLDEVAKIEKNLRSNDFETFYKIFPIKDYATQLPERQNLSKIELAKTNWFKVQIEGIIK